MKTQRMIEIDGSMGEGGGQIVRSSLSLSLATGQPFRIRNIRARRDKPGLLRQHLTAVNAAVEVSGGRAEGAALGVDSFAFWPGSVSGGDYSFSIGSAGSTMLVLQTILPALLLAEGTSTVQLEGGTHNPFAPPFDFLDRVLFPIVRRMGAGISAKLERPGYFPAGGGRCSIEIEPTNTIPQFDLLERGEITNRRGVVQVAMLSKKIGERELATVRGMLSWPDDCFELQVVRNSAGLGNVVFAELEAEHVTELFTDFGRRGVKAERVARSVAKEVRDYLAAAVPVGPYLADQLLLLLALGGGGSYRTLTPTLHCTTNADVIREFLGVRVSMRQENETQWRVDVGEGGGERGQEMQ